MGKFWKKTIILAAIGFALGILVGLGFLSITGVEKYLAEKGMDGLALYLALSGLLGAVGMGDDLTKNNIGYALHWGEGKDFTFHFYYILTYFVVFIALWFGFLC